MMRFGVLVVAITLAAIPNQANAADLCAKLASLTDEARQNFAERSDTGTFTVDLPSTPSCSLQRQLGGSKTLNCRWAFAFRDAQARQDFARLTSGVASCKNVRTVLEKDQRVNHPDSYDLRKFEQDGIAVDVSLKDKGALQQTFVFLRIKPD